MARLVVLFLALITLFLLAYLSRRPRYREDPALSDDLDQAIAELALRSPARRMTRLPAVRKLIPMMQRILSSRADWSALTLLREHQRELGLGLLQLEKNMRRPPRLPADESGHPRMLLLARELVRHDSPCDAPALLHALDLWHREAATSHAERLSLPLCVHLAAAEQLTLALRELRNDLIQAQRGYTLARRLPRKKHPERMLSSAVMTPAFADALVHGLRSHDQQDLLAALEEHLQQQGVSVAALSAAHARSLSLWAEKLLECLQLFNTISHLNWPEALESADPLHLLLQEDPTGVYPRMSLATRLHYRRRAAMLARLFRMDESRLLRGVMALCSAPDQEELCQHPGWYLLEHEGIRALRRQLKVQRGALSLWMRHRHEALVRILSGTAGVFLALMLLHRGYTLWVLPPLLMCLMPAARHFLHRLLPRGDAFVPSMHFDHIPRDLRTLVVIPAQIRSRSDALPAVRRMLLASHAISDGAVDFLLLGDYTDSLTATSAEDSAVTCATLRGVEALNTQAQRPRFHYLHRSRVYSRTLRRYTGRSGVLGAVDCVCRLISEGSSPDAFDEATVSPDSLHRRYARVMIVPPDATLAPDTLLQLLGALEHPLNRCRAAMALPDARPDPDTLRTRLGLVHAAQSMNSMCFLADPAVLTDALEQAEDSDSPLILQELAGCICVPDSRVYPAMPATLFAWMMHKQQRSIHLWQQLSWLLPWRSAEHGVTPSPLSASGRRRLRRALMASLRPAATLAALLCAALQNDALFLMLFLLLPALHTLRPMDQRSSLRLLTYCCLLPLHAAVQLEGMLRALWLRLMHREFPYAAQDTLPPLENWSQTLCALTLALSSLAGGRFCLPGLMLSAVFGCFPLLHTHLDRPVHHPAAITADTESALMDAIHATWRYFTETVGEASHHLPPEGLQVKPWRGASGIFHPDDAGLYLLCCLCACELELISPNDMALRITQTVTTLEQLPLWQGLPYDTYDLATLTPASTRVDAQRSGLYCACLLCAAQGIRARLAQLDAAYEDLPARLDALAHAIPLELCYDKEARLLFTGIRTETSEPEAGHHDLYASASLITSFTGVMLGLIPPVHLVALSRTRVRTAHTTALCSPTGSAEDYLLPLLLLPLTPSSDHARTISAVIRAQRSHAMDGMFGFAPCAVWQFDSMMNYLRRPSGLPELALHPAAVSKAIAPYAATLCLPFDLPNALDSLMRLRSHGMLGHMGFFDSLDMDNARLNEGVRAQAVQCYASSHQAILLCALCNTLTDHHLVRTFMAIPAAAACSLLLRVPRPHGLLLMDARHRAVPSAPQEPSFRRVGMLHALPVDAHVIGSVEASVALTAHGLGIMRCRGLNLTRFTGQTGAMEGLQFYLSDGAVSFRLGDPALNTETIFSEGVIRLTQRTQDLQLTLTILVDPASGTFLHTLEILNLTGMERFLDVSDCLIPGFAPQEQPLRASHPSDRVLTLATPDATLTLCHVLTTADPLILLHAHTDQTTFSPDTHPGTAPQDRFSAFPRVPCMGFHARLSLGVRGRTTLMFTTRLLRKGEAFSLESLTPRATDLPGATALSRLGCRAVYDLLGMNQSAAATASRIAGVMLWQGQPHQGPVAPLTLPFSALGDAGLDPALPLMTLLLYTPDGLPLFEEAAAAVGWLNLSGHTAGLCVVCMGSEAPQAAALCERALAASPARPHVHFLQASALQDGLRETIEAASRLLLYEGAGSLSDQLDALVCPTAELLPLLDPESVPLPEEPLRFADDHSGWQEQTNDLVLRLMPGEPAPHWDSLIPCGAVDACHTPQGSTDLRLNGDIILSSTGIWLKTAAGCITPMDSRLARRVQFSPTQTRWQSCSAAFDADLTASPMPGCAACLHTLRLKNNTSRAMELTLMLSADFGTQAYLSPIASGMATTIPAMQGFACLSLCEGNPQVRRLSAAAWAGESMPPAGLLAPDEDTGSTAVLSLPLTLTPHGSATVSWISGVFTSAEELDARLAQVRHEGASALMRSVRQASAQLLSRLTLASPDEALNLLMNRLLPHQILLNPAHTFLAELCAVSPLCLTNPALAREKLLLCAGRQFADSDVPVFLRSAEPSRMPGLRLMLVIQAASYVRATGDADVLAQHLPYQDGSAASLHAHLMQALTSIRLGKHGLPMTEAGVLPDQLLLPQSESVLLGMLFAWALQECAPLSPPEDRSDIQEVLAHLVKAIDQAGWDGSWFRRGYTASGMPVGSAQAQACRIDALTQGAAVAALGVNPHTAQAIDSAWSMLWDASAGILRSLTPPFDAAQEPASPTLLAPGDGSNGGVDAFSALSILHALCLSGEHDRAWLLVHMLNPAMQNHRIHTPWLVPAGMDRKGLPLPAPSDFAGLMYTLILDQLLGFRLEKDGLRLMPHVPKDWDYFTLTLHYGASTWHFHLGRSESRLTLDGEAVPNGLIPLSDDGHIHQVRAPIS